MNKLGKLALAAMLVVVLTGTTFAGGTNTSPCAAPGEIESPPCSTTELLDDEASEASSNVSGGIETVIFEAATYAVENLFTLF